MKTQLPTRRNEGLTLVEVLIIVTVIAILAAMLIPIEGVAKYRAKQINCVHNLAELGAASRIWTGDNSTNISSSAINEARTKALLAGNVAAWFQVMSNDLGTPKFLICPADRDHHIAATDFADLHNSNISYFVNPDANETYPQMILFGDDNLQTNNVPLKSGLFQLTATATVSWTDGRHGRVGNIAFADGSVAQVSSSGLQQAAVLATNGVPWPSFRLAIP